MVAKWRYVIVVSFERSEPGLVFFLRINEVFNLQISDQLIS